jgi:murein L,D-transpeptidase YafK
MTDYGMEEIYGLVAEAFQGGQAKIQLQAFPFRMTGENLVRHEQDPNASLTRRRLAASHPWPIKHVTGLPRK